MAKYYISCGSVQYIWSTSMSPQQACQMVLLAETNENDILDEYAFVDERGFRDGLTADKSTSIYNAPGLMGLEPVEEEEEEEE